ncbi:MAG: ABC transporter ATP-binding protein [Gammaproteobacteria bacterium]|nr:ABC transporter ATP-binding protein [Gammaproteobacteria bacterium]MCW8987107.1 ABC transporter ATP-binding protein [Gammaproteobacteria bacterium]
MSSKYLTVKIADTHVCEKLTLSFDADQSWAILGMNGCGKTTLLHTMAGLLPAHAGDIKLNNTNLNDLSRREIAQQVGLLLQHQEDHFPGTVLEAVLIGRHPHLKSWQWESENDKQLVFDALEQVGLNNFAQRPILTLSGGERQRVALATLLVQQTKVRLLDEPVNHLDIHHQHEVMKILTSNNDNITNVFVLHDVNLAAQYCNHALLIFGKGETVQGNSKDVLTEENLTKLYQHPIKEISLKNQRWFIAN